MSLHKYLSFLLTFLIPLAAVAQSLGFGDFDVLIKNGTVYDGSGRAPRRVDVGIKEDSIVAIGNLRRARARNVIDARGLAVAPGGRTSILQLVLPIALIGHFQHKSY